MEPIPSYMLKMTITHTPKTGVDGFGNPSYGVAAPVSKVFVEPNLSAVQGSFGDKQRYDATVFYDAKVSVPAGRAFGELDKVFFSGRTYIVRTVLETYDPYSGRLSFLEVRIAGA